jgi:hypothetical protein
MSAISLASPDWLALRGPADAAARSGELAEAAAALVAHSAAAGPLVVHDLGAGTGAMMRWLAPRLPGSQTWVLHDGDAGMLDRARADPGVDAAGRSVRIRTSVEELGGLARDAFADASLVTASALLDVLTADDARAIVDACVAAGVPALFCLSVTGRVAIDPARPDDDAFARAFDDHQRRTTAGRRLLGPDAPDVVAGLFAAAGWRVRRGSTPWRLGPDDRALAEEWLDGRLAAAVEQRPELAERAAARRRGLVGRGFTAVVDHEDLLAWPS